MAKYTPIKTQLLDLISRYQIATNKSDGDAGLALMSDHHFITRLRKPKTQVHSGTIDKLFKRLAKYNA